VVTHTHTTDVMLLMQKHVSFFPTPVKW